MSPITTHVLDTSQGKPGRGIRLVLEFETGGSWTRICEGVTDDDGRAKTLLPAHHKLAAGKYRLSFALEEYFRKQSRDSFFPEATLTFEIKDPKQHYHVPLLISGHGYSTYRGT